MNYKKGTTSKIRKIDNTRNRNKKQKKTKKIYANSNKYYKLSGGLNNNNSNTSSTTNNENNEIMDEVKKEREFNLGDSNIIKKTGELGEGFVVKSIEGFGNLLGVDLSSSQNTGEKLEQIKIALADPKNKEKVKQIISEAAQVGAVAIEAASPFIKPLVDKSITVGSEALSKMSESFVKIGLNTAEEIPGVGVVIGSIRSLSNAGEAFLAGINAAGEVITASSDTINAATKNFQQLMKEKMSRMNNINDSVKNFQEPFNVQNQLQMQDQPQIQNSNLSGGNTCKYKMKKTKRYNHSHKLRK
jgi:hypothetical protein